MTGVPSPNTSVVIHGGIGRGSGKGVLEAGGLVGACCLMMGGMGDWGAKFWMASTREF